MDLKSCKTSKGFVEMVILWQLCRTIGPLLSQRFLLASAKAQPRGGFHPDCKIWLLNYKGIM